MLNFEKLEAIDPYIRMMRLKKSAALSGKWRDIDHVFTYIVSGTADFVIEGNRYTVSEGDVILIPPYQTHLIVSRGQELLVQYIFHFDFFKSEERILLKHRDILTQDNCPGYVPDDKEGLLEGQVIIASIPEEERMDLMRLYLVMRKEFADSRPGRELLLKAACRMALTYMLRYLKPDGALEELRQSSSKSWIHVENAINYIQNGDIARELTNEQIAAAIGVSPNYLTRAFQKHIGISLHKYIVTLRMERAQQLLLSGRLNVSEAAAQVGYSSVFVFSKAFKRLTGVSPSDFINYTVNIEEEDKNIELLTYPKETMMKPSFP